MEKESLNIVKVLLTFQLEQEKARYGATSKRGGSFTEINSRLMNEGIEAVIQKIEQQLAHIEKLLK